jgi:hypothetical protein
MVPKKAAQEAPKPARGLPHEAQKQQPAAERKPAVSYAEIHRSKRSNSQGPQKQFPVGASKYGGLAQPLIPQKATAAQQPVQKNAGPKQKLSVKQV